MFGYHGDLSPAIETLLLATAEIRAERMAMRLGIESGKKKFKGILANKIRNKWAMTRFRENAQLKLINLRWVAGFTGADNPRAYDADTFSGANRMRDEYRYAYDDYVGPRPGGFGGRHRAAG